MEMVACEYSKVNVSVNFFVSKDKSVDYCLFMFLL